MRIGRREVVDDGRCWTGHSATKLRDTHRILSTDRQRGGARRRQLGSPTDRRGPGGTRHQGRKPLGFEDLACSSHLLLPARTRLRLLEPGSAAGQQQRANPLRMQTGEMQGGQTAEGEACQQRGLTRRRPIEHPAEVVSTTCSML